MSSYFPLFLSLLSKYSDKPPNSEKKNIYFFRHVFVKYSNRGLFNEKGKMYPLFEKLYFVVSSFFVLFSIFNIFAHITTTTKDDPSK